jgi:16S rRNA (guanine966-N2)-methyltransferase
MAAVGGRLEGASVVDLFAGSGALGLEALSRGASSVVFVERARGALKTLEGNIHLLGAETECRIVRGDALAFLRRLEPRAFDLALADPPYDGELPSRVLELFLEKGFARELWVEHRSGADIPPTPGLRQRRYGDTTLSVVAEDE